MRKIANLPYLLAGALMLFSNLPALAEDYTELDCLVKPEMYINVSSPVDGVLELVSVKKSDSVKKGQVLAKLDASVETSQVSLAEQEALMDNLIHAKQSRYEFIQRKMARLASLQKRNMISAQEYDEAVTESDLAKSELIQVKQDKKTNELKLAMARAELNQKTIKSPIDGVVVENFLMPGESVENKAIVQLAKIDPLLVEVIAPANLFGKIQANMAVEVYPDTPTNTKYQANVSIIDKIIDAASGSFSIRLSLPNPDAKLIGGSKCIARFPIKPIPKVTQAQAKSADEELPEDIKALLK